MADNIIVAPRIDQLPLVGVNAILQDREGFIWYATTEGGLCRDDGYTVDVFRNDRANPMRLGHSNGVLSICETSKGDICFGTRENIYLLRKSDYSIVPLDTTIAKGKVRLIKVDRQGRLVAVTANGVCTYDQNYKRLSVTPFTLTEQEFTDSINHLYSSFKDSHGRLWFLDNMTPFVRIPRNNYISQRDVTEADSENMEQPALQIVYVNGKKTKVCKGTKGTLFCGDEDGITVNGRYISGLSNIRDMTPALDGGIYFISAHAALAYCSQQGRVTEMIKGGESKNVCTTPDGTVWIGGWQGQVWRYDTKNKALILDEIASTNNCDPVNGIASDRHGALWILTDKQIKIYDRKSGHVRIITNKNRSINITKFQGICRNADGSIKVTGTDGILTLRNNLQQGKGRIGLTAVIRDGVKEYMSPNATSITIPATVTNTSLLFSTFDHVNTSEIVISYRINGGRWIELLPGTNAIQLTALPKGTYTVDVKANDVDNWSESTSTITLKRLPAWWETWWAYLLYSILTIGTVVAVDRAYVRYRDTKRRVAELQKRIEQLLLDHDVKIENVADKIADNSQDREFIERAIQLVKQHLADSDYDVAQFASDLCMSRATLYRMFTSTTGQKPLEFIRSIRLKRAEELLSNEPRDKLSRCHAVTLIH
ncbi:MAG: helix-turn-helix domain-containing protein [Prevotella sp.]|nr:helix-turn-helix domain-containing protein [Candidatus Prevotella equi]